MATATLLARATLGAAVLMLPPALHAATLTTVYSFTGGIDGDLPVGPLLNVGGILYGAASAGHQPSTNCLLDGEFAVGCGIIFKFNPKTSITKVIYRFKGLRDGAFPGPLINVGGSLYGTTGIDGRLYAGTVFAIDPGTDVVRTVHSFDYSNGGSSSGGGAGGPLISVGGALYGTTWEAGPAVWGAVYKLDYSTGKERILHLFDSSGDGQLPGGGLLNMQHTLYGTTRWGGTFDVGTAFKVDIATQAEAVLHSFGGVGDGSYPSAALINVGGMLYGTTANGGASSLNGTSGYGTVFMIDPSTGNETVLHSFNYSDGAYPAAPLLSVGTTLYGTTPEGGPSGTGTIFGLDLTTGQLTTLYNFGPSGASPSGALIDVGGVLYGTTSYGGAQKLGSIFSLTP